MVYDIILCGILIIAFLIGLKRGLLRTIWGISALTLSIFIAFILHPYAAESFENSVIADNISNYVYEKIAAQATDRESDIIYTLPESLQKNTQLIPENRDSARIEAVAESITTPVINVASGLFLFILVRIALAVVYNILKLIFSFPVLKQTNKLAGGIVQTVIALAVVYTILAIAAISGTDVFNDSVICKIMYDNNIILTILAYT